MHVFTWTWDPTLYAGSAEHYADGRRPYPPALAGAIRDALGLDGAGRLLDVGCGPGALTTLLAPLFAEAIGVDADPGMIRVARERAPEITWRELRAEELPAGLGRFRAITFAQSFHWMDQPVVARAARDMLTPDGAWVHVHATTHRGVGGDNPPPWDEIQDLVRQYLGPEQRAGQGTLPTGTRGREEDVMRAEGWAGPTRLEVEQPGPVVRPADEVVAAVLSLSGSAPHLFGDRLPAFVDDLRGLLHAASPSGEFSERLREIGVVIWRLP